MKKAAYIFIASLTMLPVFLSERPLEGAERPQTVFQEIRWEQLLPKALRGDGFSADSAAGGEELDAYIDRRIHAPANPFLQGRDVRIHGFVVPLERDENAFLTEFLLVPYFGACVHVPPPPQNQVIHVVPDSPAQGIQSMDAVFVSGSIGLERTSSNAGEAAYRIQAVKIERDTSRIVPHTALAAALTLLCGLSVCLGCVGPVSAIRLRPHALGWGLSLAAGIMACLGLSTLIAHISMKIILLFFLGAFFMAAVEFPVRAEKGRHPPEYGRKHPGIGPALAIGLHNLPECFIVFTGAVTSTGLGLVLGGAMIAHNIPLGLSIALSTGEASHPRRIRRYVALAGLVPPVAAVLAYLFLRPLLAPETVRMVFAVAGGALFFVAFYELVPLAGRYCGRSTVFAGFLSGAALLLCTLMFSYRGDYGGIL